MGGQLGSGGVLSHVGGGEYELIVQSGRSDNPIPPQWFDCINTLASNGRYRFQDGANPEPNANEKFDSEVLIF